MTHVPANRLPELVPAYRDLPSLLLDQLSQHAHIVELTAGQNLFREGDLCNYHQVVLEGRLRIQKVANDGHEIVVGHVDANHACNLSYSCLLGGHHYAAEAIAEVDSKVLLIAKDSFFQLMDHLPGFRQEVYRDIKHNITDLINLIQEIAFENMDHRLAALLIRLGNDHKSINTTHQALAIELGTAREVISRLLKKFERRHWVELHRGYINILDPERLKNI